MPTNIAVITQEENEHKHSPNANPTMALPFLAPTLIHKIQVKKQMTQRTLFGKLALPTHENVPVNDHYCGNTYVPYHMRRVQIRPNGNKKKSKNINTKKKAGKEKHGAFPKEADGCKESIQLACSLHIQELRDLVKGSKK